VAGCFDFLAFYVHDSDRDVVGFFALVGSDGEIRQLILRDVDISGHDYVGGLIGINRGRLSDCRINGRVSGNRAVGGLIGWNWPKNLESGANVNVQVSGNEHIGQIIGLDSSPRLPPTGGGR